MHFFKNEQDSFGDSSISFVLFVVFLFALLLALYEGVELTTPKEALAAVSDQNIGVSFIPEKDGIHCIRSDGKERTGFVVQKGNTYYFDQNGVMQTGIVKIGKSVFGFDEHGKQLYGPAYVNGALYDFSGEAHSAVVGLVELGGGWYDFQPDGRQALGIQRVDGKIYAFTGKDGVSVTGWINEGLSHYLIADDHQEQNGIRNVDGALYHFQNSKTVSGEYTENGKHYSFTGNNNAAITNTWSNDHQYYYGNDGIAVVGVQLIDGKYYRFQEDGKLAECLGTKEEYEARLAAERLQQILQKAAENQGDAGNICVPDLGINTALYSCNIHVLPGEEDIAQEVCDRENSAVYLPDCAQPIIADHNYQGFSALANAQGKYMYLTHGAVCTRYLCTGVYSGINQITDVICNGKSIINNRIASLVAYTCNTSWQDILVFTFEPA